MGFILHFQAFRLSQKNVIDIYKNKTNQKRIF